MIDSKPVLSYLRSARTRHLAELSALLQIPSVSTKPEHNADVAAAARWVAHHLEGVGLTQVTIHPTAGHPVITATSTPRPHLPTVLIYAHYDVQPAEPLELWTSPPFEPTLRGQRLYARGAADDKGQLFAHLAVMEAFSQVRGEFPVNLKVIFEGEEEIGSPQLYGFIRNHAAALAADVIVVSDTAMPSLRRPSLTVGLRGLCCAQIDVRTAREDLHSGLFGGTIPNALQVLAELLVTCKDPRSGKVLIPQFYQQVQALSAKERKRMAQATLQNETTLARAVGARGLYGERGFSAAQRVGARPTFEINGIWGGYTDEGMKTVLPCQAHAKVSMRLVPDQQPQHILSLFEQHLKAVAPAHAQVRVRRLGNNAPALRVDPDFPAMRLAAAALKKVFGNDPVYRLEGGSVPVLSALQQAVGVPPLMLGFGLPDDKLHAPNESFDVRMFDRATATLVHFFDSLASQTS